ncbi:RING-H2 finger protein ATL57-like [Actinidia eriantha]|uniref:RING-H2 finger protein ATL57-like n=1 Tax=Actinidia eriantha TaxID=165200 RepID=UPI002588CEC5|nr:RING-H2 finger protein ATL57-like [Actinidia eriantha]
MKPQSRKFLQVEDAIPRDTLSPPVTYSPDPLLQPMNGSSTTLSNTRPFRPNSPFDSSMALTALILLTALFFVGFFSIYIRRFADTVDSPSASSRGRRSSPLPTYPSSSSLPPWRSTIFHKGLHPSAVQSLPLISYGGGAKHQIDCAICLAEFEDRETVKLIPHCGHVFHPECIDKWLSSRVACPLCRSSRLFSVEEGRSCVSQGEEDHVGGGDEQRPTAEMDDTWVDVSEVGPVMLRRACSCPSLGDPAVVQRSLGFFLTP